MKKHISTIVLIAINLIVIFYIDNRITLHDLDYYNGKDGGLIIRFETAIIMSAVYFFLLTKKNKIIFFFLGVIIGVLSTFISYLILGKLTSLNDVFYQLTTTILFIWAFHFIEKKLK
jgi:hypothetical protein